MAVDATLNEICELLKSATRARLLEWKSDYIKEILTATLGDTIFTINASAPTSLSASWLISLTVTTIQDRTVKEVFSKTLNSASLVQKEDAEALVEVWELAESSMASQQEEGLEPVIKSLRAAILEKQKV